MFLIVPNKMLTVILCPFLLLALVGVQTAEFGPVVQVAPVQINLGLTTFFEVNCSFVVDKASELAALISLTVSRSNDSGKTFTEVASITEFTPTIVNLATSESIQADGLINQARESYIHLNWKYPSAIQGGLYQCSSQGIDFFGHSIIMTGSADVLVDEPNTNEFVERIREMENYTNNLEETMLLLQSERDNCTDSIQIRMAELDNLNKSLQLKSLLLDGLLLEMPVMYGISKYYICESGTYNAQMSMDICNRIGGYLLEIQTEGEFQAIQAYLSTTTGFKYVLIGGTNANSEGTWVLPSTGQSPYLKWEAGRPFTDGNWNCLYLYPAYQCLMFDYVCSWGSLQSNIPYICEVPLS